MSSKTVTTHFCDFCGNAIDPDKGSPIISKTFQKHGVAKIPVLFDTEQTEGTPCKPYWSTIPLPDLCEDCARKLFPAIASGANGYASIYIDDKEIAHNKHISELGK